MVRVCLFPIILELLRVGRADEGVQLRILDLPLNALLDALQSLRRHGRCQACCILLNCTAEHGCSPTINSRPKLSTGAEAESPARSLFPTPPQLNPQILYKALVNDCGIHRLLQCSLALMRVCSCYRGCDISRSSPTKSVN